MAVPFQRDIRVEDADHMSKSLDPEDPDAVLVGLVVEQVKKYVHCLFCTLVFFTMVLS